MQNLTTQQQIKNRLIKQVKKTFPKEEIQLLEIDAELALETEPVIEIKPKREKKKTPREQQMNKPLFNNNFEKYEWLMANGCTNPEDRNWLTNYIRTITCNSNTTKDEFKEMLKKHKDEILRMFKQEQERQLRGAY